MNAMISSLRSRPILSIVVGMVLAAAIGLPAAVRAAAYREMPSVTVDVDDGVISNTVRKGQGAPPAPPGTTTKPTKMPAGTLSSTTSDVVYTITVTNLGHDTTPNLEVDYHFFNRITDHTNGGSSMTVDDITGTENIVVPVNGKKLIQTTAITKATSTVSAAPAGAKNTGARNSRTITATAQTTTNSTALMGWYIVVKTAGVVIFKKGSDPDILDKVAQINNRNSGKSGTDF